ncbi:hypothetical protein M8818_003514 [Zalaria obscura]|uniref:Uncharacterized protein n=1 Tax=Zalaria obscura TaxID=2024903 RepID=A0ACC3SIU6_9PEZI
MPAMQEKERGMWWIQKGLQMEAIRRDNHQVQSYSQTEKSQRWLATPTCRWWGFSMGKNTNVNVISASPAASQVLDFQQTSPLTSPTNDTPPQIDVFKAEKPNNKGKRRASPEQSVSFAQQVFVSPERENANIDPALVHDAGSAASTQAGDERRGSVPTSPFGEPSGSNPFADGMIMQHSMESPDFSTLQPMMDEAGFSGPDAPTVMTDLLELNLNNIDHMDVDLSDFSLAPSLMPGDSIDEDVEEIDRTMPPEPEDDTDLYPLQLAAYSGPRSPVRRGSSNSSLSNFSGPITSPALYHAVSSMTAFHSSRDIATLRVAGHEHKDASVRYLLQGINENTMELDNAIATTLTLAFAEVWDQHISTGNDHIKGARSLIHVALEKHRQQPLTGVELQRLKFLCNAWLLLETWDPPAYIESPEDPTSSVQHTLQTAEAYRWATLLYLQQAVPEIPSLPSSEMARKVLAYLATVPLASRTVVVQIFPLMSAGPEADTAEDRQWVRDRWRAMEQRMRLGLLNKCMELTAEVWRRRDTYNTPRSSTSPERTRPAGMQSPQRSAPKRAFSSLQEAERGQHGCDDRAAGSRVFGQGKVALVGGYDGMGLGSAAWVVVPLLGPLGGCMAGEGLENGFASNVSSEYGVGGVYIADGRALAHFMVHAGIGTLVLLLHFLLHSDPSDLEIIRRYMMPSYTFSKPCTQAIPNRHTLALHLIIAWITSYRPQKVKSYHISCSPPRRSRPRLRVL